jgi:peptidoglycan/LPS O-acetylase OafA/YrhL
MYLVFISPPDASFSLRDYFGLMCAGLILISFLTFPIPEKLWGLCHYLGSRSFSLYACHAPVLWLFKRVVFGPVSGKIIQPEVIYRIIDIPATNVSKRNRLDL